MGTLKTNTHRTREKSCRLCPAFPNGLKHQLLVVQSNMHHRICTSWLENASYTAKGQSSWFLTLQTMASRGLACFVRVEVIGAREWLILRGLRRTAAQTNLRQLRCKTPTQIRIFLLDSTENPMEHPGKSASGKAGDSGKIREKSGKHAGNPANGAPEDAKAWALPGRLLQCPGGAGDSEWPRLPGGWSTTQKRSTMVAQSPLAGLVSLWFTSKCKPKGGTHHS